jgi:peptidoglycan-associated lipoprotein
MKTLLLITCIGTLALCGCHKQMDRVPQYAGADGDTVTGTPLPERQEGVSFFGSNVTRNQFPPIFFGFDQSQLGSDEDRKIQQIAVFMKHHSNTIILAGFTDERGTEEYNRALGERRAQTVRNTLIGLGISSGRIQTVSFGQDMPSDPGHNETAWDKNRRVETGVVR